jgi:hypothetical protein
MIHFQTEFSDGVVAATSYSGKSPDELWTGTFDFGLVGVSWDKRCTAISKCNSISFNSVALVAPQTTVSLELLSSHREIVHDFCQSNSKLCNVLETETETLSGTFERIRSLFWAAVGEANRTAPAKIFIDVSTCPRYLSLALLREALFSGIVSEVCLGYSEGKYPEASPSYNDLEEIAFSDGAFQALPVPGYYGEFEPSKGRLFIVSLGFDGWKTLNLLIRKEPERVLTLLSSPGGSPDYEERALSANSALFERFGLSADNSLRATSGDAVEAWRKISEASLEDVEKENIYYLCSGNKPHSIAFALRALSLESPTLLYNSPLKHLPLDIDFNGKFWMYSIKPVAGTVLG